MVTEVWFFSDVELNFMKLYSLVANGREICEVEIETPSWLPVRPTVPKQWLRTVLARALHQCFPPEPTYLECHDRSTSSAVLN